MNKHSRIRPILSLALIIIVLTTTLILPPTTSLAAAGILKIHMLSHSDGRNDSFIFELPNGEVMVIDNYDHNALISKLGALGINSVKYLVGTHQHVDHIGGLDNFINSGFNINNTKIYYPEGPINTTNAEYTNLVNAAGSKSKTLEKLVDGDYILNTTYDGKPLIIKCLGPIWWRVNGYDNDYTTVNDASLVLKITYGTKSILMMADTRELVESDLLNYRDSELNGIQVMKIGHHGIRDNYEYSASDAFLNRTGITKALVTNGTHDFAVPIVENLQERNITYWSTGQYGVKGPDVAISTDGTADWTSDSAPYWEPGDTGTQYYFIVHNASGLKLHPLDNGDVDLNYDDKFYYNLRWRLIDAGSGYYYIQNMEDGTKLYCTTDGSDVYMVSSSNTSNNVKWQLSNLDATYKLVDNIASDKRLHAKESEAWLLRTTSKVYAGPNTSFKFVPVPLGS